MRLGQTSVVHFGSQLLVTVAGFVANIYFVRTLGGDTLGAYFLVLGVLAWLSIVGDLGIRTAVKKRMSGTGEEAAFFTAGLLAQVVVLSAVAALVLVFADPLNRYLGVEAATFVALLLVARVFLSFVRAALDGSHLVYVSSLLNPLEWGGRTTLQVTAVFFGFGLSGMLWGYFGAAIFAIAAGLFFLPAELATPDREHFDSLFSYSRYSWLAEFRHRSFLSMDTVVLGLFVSTGFIAIYEIAWNIASVLAIFGTSVSKTLFPEISEQTSRQSAEKAVRFTTQSLLYCGLFIAPGLVGAVVVGDLVLALYDPEFVAGYWVLLVLIVARGIQLYHGQLTNVLSAIDRPDAVFRIDAAFVLTNLSLNVALVYSYGWMGAAVATTISAVVGLVLAYYALSSVIDVSVPVVEIGKQWVAALTMGGATYYLRTLMADSTVTLLILVGIGAGIYFVVLWALSGRFRRAVVDNVPGDFLTGSG
ncbi:lipopolysaccharide biosynthesis protein [Salinilacihabitans rarus]|uniref:lipopolysaccharide biosynthesis protein n=1 Tax=Salinilacihabitans rarus TaxID=2961596 RepID=UPI0021138FA2|nr:polysaccharide biosynthesis C-terminal domain-containing protein [Salinilacihabitans rarus]